MAKIKLDINHAVHEGGTKFYTIIEIEDLDSTNHKSHLIKIYGPLEKYGSVTHEEYTSSRGAYLAAESLKKKKIARGYPFASRVELFDFRGIGELQKVIDDRAEEHLVLSVAKLLKKYNAEILNGVRALMSDKVISDDYGLDDLVGDIKAKPTSKPEPVRNSDWGSW